MLRQAARNGLPRLSAPLLVLVLTACAGQPPGSGIRTPTYADSSRAAAVSFGDRVASIAAGQVGVPYRYGGTSSATGFDCSGLVHYAYARAGRSVPRTAGGLWEGMQPVETGDLRRGDVLFFNIEGKMSHVAVYLGDRRFVHAPSAGRAVTVATLDADFYRATFIRGGRL